MAPAKPIAFGRTFLKEHRHVCAFFHSPREEYDTLIPFICDGLNCGERALHVLPTRHMGDHEQRLRKAGVDVEAKTKSGQLAIATPEQTYMRTGKFDKEDMLNCIQEALQEGKRLGFPLTRMIAHAETAVTDWASGQAWVEYEMRLNAVLPNYDDTVICTYDANLLSGPLAIDILRTHPVAIVGGVLYQNPFAAKSEDFLDELRQRSAQDHQAYRA
jgi:hypothetical protein